MSAFHLRVDSRSDAHCFRCSRSSLISPSKASSFLPSVLSRTPCQTPLASWPVPGSLLFRRQSPGSDILAQRTTVVGPLLLLSEMHEVRPFPGWHSRWNGTPDWPVAVHYWPAPWPTDSSLTLGRPTPVGRNSWQFPSHTCA